MWPLQIARVRNREDLVLPAAVVRPASVDDVSAVLRWCADHDTAVIPAGARSGVCGGVLVDPEALGGREVVALDLRSLAGVEVDATDLLATSWAGTPGPAYEDALAGHGLTGGHYPQSLHISTVGGWLACRSAGQFSTAHGKAEDMVAGLEVVLASGEVVNVGPQPSSAAGPDLARLFLGSEGTLGVIVRATLRVVRSSDRVPRAFRFPGFGRGLEAVQKIIQAGARPAVVRLYDEDDTAWSFPDVEGSMLVAVFDGHLAAAEADYVTSEISRMDGEDLGQGPAEHWLEHRFDAVETFEQVMRSDGPLGPNAIVDTMEVAGRWSNIDTLYAEVRRALQPHALGVLCHASHVYPDGACLYYTFAVQADDEDGAQHRYRDAWQSGMDACLAAGGTITHHHGVGRLKAEWFRRELGEAGWQLLTSLKRSLDPHRILNPGNLGL